MASSLGGCGARKQVVSRAVDIPLPAPSLTMEPAKPPCETPGTGDLTVPDLENERDCYRDDSSIVRARFKKLAGSIEQTAQAVRVLRNRK